MGRNNLVYSNYGNTLPTILYYNQAEARVRALYADAT